MLEQTEKNLEEVRQQALEAHDDTLYDVACTGLALLRRVRELSGEAEPPEGYPPAEEDRINEQEMWGPVGRPDFRGRS